MTQSANPFFGGVVEGFYGRPWNARQRHQLFTWMRQWKLNTYLYAPKDELKHRTRWRELYAEMEVAELAALIRDCQRHEIQFIYALSPGLDLRCSSAEEMAQLKAKLAQVMELGGRHFALLFDDIPPQMTGEDAKRFQSVAHAQSYVANDVLNFVRAQIPETHFLFCPTLYCGRMAKEGLGYLQIMGELLEPSIDLLWTGPEVISETISAESIRDLSSLIKRKPILWDNLHANDYDLQQVFLGPYSGRYLGLKREVKGILSNPNCQFEVNFVPLRTLSLYVGAQADWHPRQAYLDSQKEWLSAFGDGGQGSVTLGDLELLGDLFYLPHECGARAQQFLDDVEFLLNTAPADWGKRLERFTQTCAEICQLSSKMAAIQNRDLLYSLHPYLAEVNQAARLFYAYVRGLQTERKPGEYSIFPEHAEVAFRGGFVSILQRLLLLDEQRRSTPVVPKDVSR